jgi:hypothetical protein
MQRIPLDWRQRQVIQQTGHQPQSFGHILIHDFWQFDHEIDPVCQQQLRCFIDWLLAV